MGEGVITKHPLSGACRKCRWNRPPCARVQTPAFFSCFPCTTVLPNQNFCVALYSQVIMAKHGTADAVAAGENSAGDSSTNTGAGSSVRRLRDADSPAEHETATTVFVPRGRKLDASTQV